MVAEMKRLKEVGGVCFRRKVLRCLLRGTACERGFTLLEMILAMSLSMVIMGIVLVALRLGVSTWESGEREAEALQNLRVVSARFLQDVSSLHHYYPPLSNVKEGGEEQKGDKTEGKEQKKKDTRKKEEKKKPKPRLLAFKGEPRSVRFIATTAPLRQKNRFMSVKEVHYFLGENDNGEKALYYEESFLHPVRSFQSFYGETTTGIPRVQDVGGNEEEEDRSVPVILMNRVKELHFSYHLLSFNTADNSVTDSGWQERFDPVEVYEEEQALEESENAEKSKKKKLSGKKIQTIDKIRMSLLLEGVDEEGEGYLLPPLEAAVYTGMFPGYDIKRADE